MSPTPRPGRRFGAYRRCFGPVGAAVLAAALALALVGCGEKPEPAAPVTDTREQPAASRDHGREIRELLNRRARALAAGDVAGFADTATGVQKTRDRRDARRARGLGLRSVEYTVANADVTERRARLPLRVVYRVRGLSGSYTAARTAVAVRTREGWRIASMRGSRQRAPWEVARFARRTTKHFVVLTPAGDDGELLPALEDAYARMREVLTQGSLERRYLVQVAADGEQARALTASIRGLATLSAITDSEVREDGPARRVEEVVSQRLLVVRSNLRDVTPESRRTVLSHELTHAALAGSTSGRTPAWLAEGLALYVSADRRDAEAAALISSGTAPTLGAFAAPDAIARIGGDAQSAAYAYSSAATHFIAERFGRRRLLDLYDAFNDEDLVGNGGEPELVDAAVRQELGVSARRLERELRASLGG